MDLESDQNNVVTKSPLLKQGDYKMWKLRIKQYFQRTGKKITINGSDTAGYDKTKVECFNCHKMRHFARKCRSLKSQESRPRNQESSRKIVIMEDTSSKAMMAIDGARFDWIYMADNEVPTNIALMAFPDSEEFSHLIKDCDIYDKKMTQKPVLKTMEKKLVKGKLDQFGIMQ
nr:hypothetical protein [Tanacetum cinerariifolium]